MARQSGEAIKLIETINAAFSAVPKPDDEHIVAAEVEHLKKCDECRDAKEFLVGKTREIILSDERNYPHLVNGFAFLTVEAWHYYLPAFLIQDLLRQRHRFDTFWHYNEPVVIEEFWPKRIARLTLQQCEAILAYLEFSRPYAIGGGYEPKLNQIIDWWQSIHQNKLSSIMEKSQ